MATLDARARLPVKLNGFQFTIDVSAYRRQTVDATRQLNDQAAEVGEQTLNSEYLWKRTAEDWRLGGGQRFFDAGEESSRRRFFDSIGIDPWSQRSLTLLNEATARHSDSACVDAWLFVCGGQLVYARNTVDGNYQIQFVDNPDATTWAFTDIVAAAAGTLESVCNDGSSIYYKVTGTNQLRRVQITGTGTFSATNIGNNANVVTNLRVVAGRLIGQTFGGVGATDYLREVKVSSDTTIASWEGGQMPVITGAVAGPAGIYLAGVTFREAGAGDWTGVQAAIYRSTIDDVSGAVGVPAPVAALPDGEAVTSALAYSGYLILGTSAGVRCARWTATGGVEYGPVIEVDSPRDYYTNEVTTNAPGIYVGGVSALEGEGPYVWFSWANKAYTHADGTDTLHSGLGRIDLSRFVTELQPAYATDLMVDGIYERPVLAACSYNDRRLFAIQGDYAYAEATTKVEQGYYSAGTITFGTAEDKRAVSVELRTDPLPDGAALNIYLTDEVGDLAHADGFAGAAAYAYTSEVTDVAGDSCALHLVLGRAWVDTEAPKLRRWTLRAMPIPARQEEIWLPVRLHDVVSIDGGATAALDIHAELMNLRALMLARTVTVLEMGDEAINVFIDNITTGADTDVKLTDWNRDERWVEGLWFIKCVTV